MSHWLMAAEVASSLINLAKYLKSFIVKEVAETKQEIDDTSKDVKDVKEELHNLNEKLEKLEKLLEHAKISENNIEIQKENEKDLGIQK